MQLFDASMHEPVSETRWDAARAEEVADRIASDTAAAWARAFAMHALEQVEQSEPRQSLWTGDIGVALYLRPCLHGWDGMPVLDVL